MPSHSRGWRLIQSIVSIASIFLAACSGGIRKHPPNILLIVMDAVRADELYCYGYDRPTTPNLDRLATGGVRFTNTVSTSSWTGPSHASLFTGLAPDEHGAVLKHNWLVNSIPTLAELLKQQGYATAGFSNNPIVSSYSNMERGFDQFLTMKQREEVASRPVPHDSELTNRLVREFIDSTGRGNSPFFVFINYMDAHTPYAPPEPYSSRFFAPGETVGPVADSANFNPTGVHPGGIEPSEQDYRTLRNLYDGALSYLDFRIGEVLDYLRDTGLADSTLVIITSDHGEIFGRWEHFTHAYLLNRPLINIPLIISFPPRIAGGLVSDRLVSITDIFHTLVKLTGASGAATTGVPQTDLLDPDASGHACYSAIAVNPFEHESFPNSHSDGHSLWTPEGKHFIAFQGQAYECYDLNEDFAEERNMYPESVSQQRIEREIGVFRDRLIPFVELPSDLVVRSSPPESSANLDALRALGYVGQAHNMESGGKEDAHTIQHRFDAEFLIGRKRYREAAAELEKVLKLNPNYIKARIMLGTILFLNNNFEQAVQAMLPLIGRQPNEVAAHLIMSLIFQELGDKTQAHEHYQEARAMGIDSSLPPEIRRYLER